MRRTKAERDTQFDLAQRCGLPSYCLDEIDRLRADLEDAEEKLSRLVAAVTSEGCGCWADAYDWPCVACKERIYQVIGRGEFRQKPLATEPRGE